MLPPLHNRSPEKKYRSDELSGGTFPYSYLLCIFVDKSFIEGNAEESTQEKHVTSSESQAVFPVNTDTDSPPCSSQTICADEKIDLELEMQPLALPFLITITFVGGTSTAM